MKTSVTTGWVVKKRFQKSAPDPKHDGKTLTKTYEKVVSLLFVNQEAANKFRDLAEKYPPASVPGEQNVEFYVTSVIGEDDLPPGL